MRVAFFGTPQAAVPTLQALIDSPHEVVGVLTAPDKPKGRGMQVEAPPVKKLAAGAGLAVHQPATLKTPEGQGLVADLNADVVVVAAYGFILPKAVLDSPRFGCINVHFSILPKYRGAAPVQWAVINGEPVTGVTIMQMDEGLDTGPMLAVYEEPIGPDDTAGTMEQKLAAGGPPLLLEVLEKVESGTIESRPQDDAQATLAPKISSADARIDWSQDARSIVNRVRGLNPRPGAWGILGGKRLKIHLAAVDEEPFEGPPGALLIEAETIKVETGTQRVTLLEVQPEGKSRMAAADFVRGYRPETGAAFEKQ
ncbi:MAG: methionyl-tRNA formyltransferase [Actinomycetota bacterium]